jgi:UDP-N-acetyl-2-amino-2-deoxyglucuronate dehydrogenase
MALINVTMLTHDQELRRQHHRPGREGHVRVGGVAVNQIEHWEFADSRPEDADIDAASYADRLRSTATATRCTTTT